MQMTLSPETWIAVHLVSVLLAAVSRVGLSPWLKSFVLTSLLVLVAAVSLLATAAFWTQQAHATFSCLTLGIVLVAVVFDRPGSPASDLVWKVASDTEHRAYNADRIVG